MLTYNIVCQELYVRHRIWYVHMMSYVVHIQCHMFSLTYNVVYNVCSQCRTFNIRCSTCTYDVDRTYDVVGALFVYRTCDVVRAMCGTMSYVRLTMSCFKLPTYDIVRDIRHRRWQESRCIYTRYHASDMPVTVIWNAMSYDIDTSMTGITMSKTFWGFQMNSNSICWSSDAGPPPGRTRMGRPSSCRACRPPGPWRQLWQPGPA